MQHSIEHYAHTPKSSIFTGALCTHSKEPNVPAGSQKSPRQHSKEPNIHTQKSPTNVLQIAAEDDPGTLKVPQHSSDPYRRRRALYAHSNDPCIHTQKSPRTQKSPVYMRKSSRTLERALGTHSKRPYIHNQRRPIYIL